MKATSLSSDRHLATTTKPRLLDGLARRGLMRTLERIEHGVLTISEDGERFRFGDASSDGPEAHLTVHDPRFYAGSMTADGARKVRRFVDLCDTFHLPIIAFVDEPGFMIGEKAERDATIRHGSEALFAVVQSQVPWCSVMVRKCYGVAGAAHFAPGAYVVAWACVERSA